MKEKEPKKYEKPAVIIFDEIEKSCGDCNNGAENTGGVTCSYTGSGASGDCTFTGNSAADGNCMSTGGSAIGSCGTNGGQAVAWCGSGTHWG